MLPLTELNHGSLRRVLRHALGRHNMQRRVARLTVRSHHRPMTQTMFWEILGLAVRRGQRNRDFFSVLLIDFDWGNLAPDIAEQAMRFKRFAERIKAVMRSSDTVAKFEKSQIIVLAIHAARRGRAGGGGQDPQRHHRAGAYGDRYVTVQAAIGIAIYLTSGSNPEDLLVRQAMRWRPPWSAHQPLRVRLTGRFCRGALSATACLKDAVTKSFAGRIGGTPLARSGRPNPSSRGPSC